MQYLYRHFDEDGELLYVGISVNPFSRLREHKRSSGWFDSVKTVTVAKYESRKAVEDAERQAIYREQPKYNIRMKLAQPEYRGPLLLNDCPRPLWHRGFTYPETGTTLPFLTGNNICRLYGIKSEVLRVLRFKKILVPFKSISSHTHLYSVEDVYAYFGNPPEGR